MDKAKSILKDGWHPEKPGQTFRQQVNGIMGRDKKQDEERANRHVTPISQLRDPASFAPPPKRADTGTIHAPSPTSTNPRKPIKFQPGTDLYSGAKQRDPLPPSVNPQAVNYNPPPSAPPQITQGLGEDSAIAAPTLPPRLPPRRSTASSTVSSGFEAPPPPPPVRSAATPAATPAAPTGAMARLANAGVSVPALGIGSSASSTSSTAASGATTSGGTMDKLSARFQRLSPSVSRTGSPAAAATPTPPPAEGTTLAQKQAALKTAQALRTDPSKVSLADMRSAASTADNFRQRHGDQIVDGAHKAQEANQKYKLTERFGQMNQKYGLGEKASGLASRFNGGTASPEKSPAQTPAAERSATPILPPPSAQAQSPASSPLNSQGLRSPPVPAPRQIAPPPSLAAASSGASSSSAASAAALVKKKPPPPPPKKKPGLPVPGRASPAPAAAGDDGAPPPIPMSTKPVW